MITTVAASTTALRTAWAAGKPTFGAWLMTGDPLITEVVGGSPLDYVVADLQHGAATPADLPTICHALRSVGRAPIVRVPWNRPEAIMRALDVGAHGVIVPMVNSAAEAAAAVDACRFPPIGQRSWGPLWGDSRPDGAPAPAEANDAVLCLVMVETPQAVADLDAIVATPGIDGVYIGPNDLALGCGLGRATYRESAEVHALLDSIIATCRRAGLVVGLHCSDAGMGRYWAARGVSMLTVATDTTVLRQGLARIHRDATADDDQV